jgi:hypothetical protein
MKMTATTRMTAGKSVLASQPWTTQPAVAKTVITEGLSADVPGHTSTILALPDTAASQNRGRSNPATRFS